MPQRDLSNLPKVKNLDSDGDSCLCLKLSAYTNLVKTFAKSHCIFTRGGGSDHLIQFHSHFHGPFPCDGAGNWNCQPHAQPCLDGRVCFSGPSGPAAGALVSFCWPPVRTAAGPGPPFSALPEVFQFCVITLPSGRSCLRVVSPGLFLCPAHPHCSSSPRRAAARRLAHSMDSTLSFPASKALWLV